MNTKLDWLRLDAHSLTAGPFSIEDADNGSRDVDLFMKIEGGPMATCIGTFGSTGRAQAAAQAAIDGVLFNLNGDERDCMLEDRD